MRAAFGVGLDGTVVESLSILRSVGQTVARFGAVQVVAPDRPVVLAALLPVLGPHPLGTEQISAGTLASLGHRYLTPGILRNPVTALLQDALPSGPELGRRALASVGYRGSLQIHWPHREARRYVRT